MVYQIGGHNGEWSDFPHTYREFWQKSHDGLFLPDYTHGFEMGKQDLAAETTTYFDILDGIEGSARGNVWRARMDGYLEATRSRGPTKFG